MFSPHSVNHERGLRFEKWQQLTDEALQRPGVRQRLGRLGTRLIELNQNAFLPNVRFAIVSIPRRYVDTDHVGILPYIGSDGDLTPDDTVLQPTPARKARVAELLGQAGRDNSNLAVDSFIAYSVAQMARKSRTALVDPGISVSSGAFNHYDERTGIVVTSRPLIIPKWQEVPARQVLRGAVGAHALVRAIDAEELLGEPDLFYSTRSTLRGFHVGAIIAEEAMASGDLDRVELEGWDDRTVGVEKARRDNGIDSDALLNGDVDYEQIGDAMLYMTVMGYL